MDFFAGIVERVVGARAPANAAEAVPAPPPVFLTKGVVEALLTLDWRERAAMHWPLVGAAELTRLREAGLQRPVGPELWSARTWSSQDWRTPVADEGVAAALTKRFPLLDRVFGVEGAAEHLLVAGGAVSAAVVGGQAHRYMAGDCDLFVYGLATTQEATALTERVMAAIAEGAAESGDDLHFHRTGHMVSASLGEGYGDNCVYQVILRLYRTAAEVLGGFDLPACAVGWSPLLGVVATRLGAFNLASGTIIIDTTRRSPSYEARLLKYSRRGFAIIAPSLSGQLPADEFHLGRLRCTVAGQPREFQLAPRGWNEGCLDDAHDYGGDAPHELVNVYRNLNVASRDDASQALVLLTGDTFEDVLERPEAIGLGSVDRLFRARAHHPFTWSHRPLLDVLRSWYGPDAMRFVQAKMGRDRAAIEAITRSTVERITRNMHSAMEQGRRGLQWITTNPGSQRHLFSGSFQPVFESPAAFYPPGHYSPSLVGLSPDMRVVLRQLRRQHRGWGSLNRDVLALLVWGYIVPVNARNVIDAYVAECVANRLPDKPKFGF